MANEFDLIIVGAGPAGMSAAYTAAKNKAKVLLLDEQPYAGGQIFRNIESQVNGESIYGDEYETGKALINRLGTQGISLEFRASVWRIDEARNVLWSRDEVSHISTARHVLLTGGAQERPMLFPGWTLPGVMPVGAAQILMKSSGLLPRDAVLVGSGPLLYWVAVQLIRAGAPPKALVDTQTPAMYLKALKHLPQALPAMVTLLKGVRYLQEIRAAKIKRFSRSSDFAVTETDHNELCLSFKSKGFAQQITAPIILTHHGIIPATNLARSAGVKHEWNEQQQCIQPVVDGWGQTNISGLHIAGDSAGIGGAEVAQASGQLAALNILCLSSYISKLERDTASRKAFTKRRRAMSIRAFLDVAYTPLAELQLPSNETIVCRCEEVTAGEIRRSVEQGADGPRQVKTTVRAGMGPCQGRLCDPTVRTILASCQVPTSLPNARSPVKPVKLGELAALSNSTFHNHD